MPPIPITGTSTAQAACHTIRSATGFIAGPESPPVILPRQGLREKTSTAIPVIVLISETADAPAETTASAIGTTSVTLGESLAIIGLPVFSRTALTTSAAACGSTPKLTPPAATLGQEILTSSPSMASWQSQTAATSA